MVRHFGLYIGVALLCSVSFPASAGFEFVAPISQDRVETPTQQVPTAPIIEELEAETLLPLMPVVDKKITVEPLAVLPVKMEEKITPVSLPDPMIEQDLPPATPVVVSTPAVVAPTLSSYDVVEGFASQVPLVIALQQVVPAQYQYAFADGVNPGIKVDWQGGKPWDQIVNDMLVGKGMIVDISGTVAYIRPASAVSEIPTANKPVAPAMPAPVVTKELIAQSGTVPLVPSEVSAPRAITNVKRSILFDSPESANLSGVTRVQQKPMFQAQSDRLELGDLSIGQPMDLVSKQQKKTPISTNFSKKVVQKKKILVAEPSVTAALPLPNFSKSSVSKDTLFDALPKTAPTALAPIKDKKILLLDDVVEKSNTSSVVPMDLSQSITPIEKLPQPEKTAMSDVMLDIMKPSASVSPISLPVLSNPSVWQATSGETLRSVLGKWANEAGTSLIWESNYDYPLKTDVQLSGNFETAVRSLLDGLHDANPRPLGRLHRNKSTGQPVLVIETDTLTN